MDIKKEIVDSIKLIVESVINKTCPTILFGVVTNVGAKGKCQVRINNIDYYLRYYGDVAPNTNTKYPVFVPFNNMSLAFIISGGKGGDKGTTDYNDLDNRPQINGNILSGNQTSSQLGLQSEITSGTTSQYWRGDKTWQTLNKSSVGLGNVDNVKQYSASNPPPYPVTSVNGEVGEITLNASDVGARPDTWTPTKSDVGLDNVVNERQYSSNNPPPYPVTSVAGKTGAVTVSKSDVGLGNVGNFKAVSTVASQGLTDTEKSNARANIGAGTYSKSSTGIPATDLASSVQTSLGKADTAVQPSSLATVATSGSYNDLTNKPDDATTSVHGLMAATDKAKLDGFNAACEYCNCATAAATATKVVATTNSNWKLNVGSIIGIKFTATNSASNVTLNVNNTGAKSIAYSTSAPYTGNSSTYCGTANRVIYYMYDGTYWRWINIDGSLNSDTIPSGHCTTAAATAAKTASFTYYTATANRYLQVNFRYANSVAGAITLNINSTGAKPIYINGSASSAGNYTLPAGPYLVYYNGTNYYLRTDGAIPTSNGAAGKLTDTTYSSMTVAEGTTGTATTARTLTAANLKQIIEAHSSGGGSSVLKFQDTIVPVSAWSEDNTYEDYPYRASIALAGVTAAMCPQVYFSMELINEPDVVYSPLSETYAGGVYIYADSIPQSAITIPSIVCI